ncbi:hypothetical protein TUA1478L_12830 [Lactiplantibacillus plantarum]
MHWLWVLIIGAIIGAIAGAITNKGKSMGGLVILLPDWLDLQLGKLFWDHGTTISRNGNCSFNYWWCDCCCDNLICSDTDGLVRR